MPTRNYGYIKDEIKSEDYRFGDANIAADILQPDGQCDTYLPPDENQAENGFEGFVTLNGAREKRANLFSVGVEIFHSVIWSLCLVPPETIWPQRLNLYSSLVNAQFIPRGMQRLSET